MLIKKETKKINLSELLDGAVLLIDKPKNKSSFFIVNEVKKKFGIKKVGHAGTLDPVATGLLIICIGKKTKEISRFQEMHKVYSGKITLGATTISMDSETELQQISENVFLYRGWTFDLAAVSGRIDRTFRALGLGEPADVLLIGYSQGASVAEMLAAREPERFTRLVLIAKPSDPEPWRFRKIKAVVTMAGTRDDQARMERASRTLGAAGVKARYFPLPGATHGEMGDDPEGTFDAVLDWLHTPSGS